MTKKTLSRLLYNAITYIQDAEWEMLSEMSADDQRKWFKNELGFRDVELLELFENEGFQFIVLPGKIIEEYMEISNISFLDLSGKSRIPQVELQEILVGKRDITETYAVGLEIALGIPKQFWITLQNNYKTSLDRKEIKDTIKTTNTDPSKDDSIVSFYTFSDAGGVLVGNEDFSVVVPNGRGDGRTKVFIGKEIPDGLDFFGCVKGTFNIYNYDCLSEEDLDKNIECKLEGRYGVYYGYGGVYFDKWCDDGGDIE